LGRASIYEFAQAISTRGYLSHIGALAIHGLVDSKLKTLYVNVEQSPKPSSSAPLTQHGIDQAFSRQQRLSGLSYTQYDWMLTIINGKHTNQLDVMETVGPSNESIRVTSLERTLIDIAVRPAYAGGITQVLAAYVKAKDRISIDRLLHVLHALAYVYPYHQSVGFLMQRAGYAEDQCMRLHALGIKYNFYAAHGTENAAYDPKWRLFYPQSLGD
jgi:predicted transcriptional regulator of viral defense system